MAMVNYMRTLSLIILMCIQPNYMPNLFQVMWLNKSKWLWKTCLPPESLIIILQRANWERGKTKAVEYMLIPKSLNCHKIYFHSFFFNFFFTLLYFTILYWFCHTLTWIHQGCTWVTKHEPLSHLLPHIISLDHTHASAPSILNPASNID